MVEVHGHPYFNGQYHTPVWVQMWMSTGTGEDPPPDVPVTCAVCGVVMEPQPRAAAEPEGHDG